MPIFAPDTKVIPVIRMTDRARALEAVALLESEGMDVFEITLTTPGALEIIGALTGAGRSTIGAGTVLSRAEAEACMDAGASFIVSPVLARGIEEICAERDVACTLGAATPSEILAAHDAGAAAVKVFPAAQLGGPGYIQAVKSVFPHISMMPTSGVGIDNIADYLAAGACRVGMGGRLADEQALLDGRPEDIRTAAREVLAVVGAAAVAAAGKGA